MGSLRGQDVRVLHVTTVAETAQEYRRHESIAVGAFDQAIHSPSLSHFAMATCALK